MGDLLAMYEARKREAELGVDEYEGVEEDELSDEEAAEEMRRQRVGGAAQGVVAGSCWVWPSGRGAAAKLLRHSC